jgi:hypothetical protein
LKSSTGTSRASRTSSSANDSWREDRASSKVSVQPSAARPSTPFQALRPSNGSFSVSATIAPSNRWKSDALRSGLSSPGEDTSSRA